MNRSTSFLTQESRWTDGSDVPMAAAQVKVFADQLADQDLLDQDD